MVFKPLQLRELAAHALLTSRAPEESVLMHSHPSQSLVKASLFTKVPVEPKWMGTSAGPSLPWLDLGEVVAKSTKA
jgi:hypothetical protein